MDTITMIKMMIALLVTGLILTVTSLLFGQRHVRYKYYRCFRLCYFVKFTGKNTPAKIKQAYDRFGCTVLCEVGEVYYIVKERGCGPLFVGVIDD